MERTIENGCRRLVHTCADLVSGEAALIISDPTTKEIGDVLAEVAKEITANVQHKIIPVADMHGAPPPLDVADIMKKSDVIFGLTKMSMAHTKARYEATSLGARYLSLPDYSEELLKREALYVDFRKISPIADYLANLLTVGKQVRVMTPLGTDVTLDITGRTGNSAPGWCYAKGMLASPPDAEVNVPPIEHASHGTWIIDGSIPCREIGILSSPLKVTIEQGRATTIEGKDADLLQHIFDSRNNPLVRVAAEFGIGLNPAAELIGSMLEDEGCLGTVHIGFGSNSTIGGLNSVPFHLDTVIRNATIYIDDVLVMEEGLLMVSPDFILQESLS